MDNHYHERFDTTEDKYLYRKVPRTLEEAFGSGARLERDETGPHVTMRTAITWTLVALIVILLTGVVSNQAIRWKSDTIGSQGSYTGKLKVSMKPVNPCSVLRIYANINGEQSNS